MRAVDDHRAVDAERPVTVTTPGPTWVTGDPDALHQVVAGLLSNTRIHIPPGTSIEVIVSGDGDTVELTVTDAGPGIPPDALPHVFERPYRADPSRSRASGGSGLGLSIVDAIVRAHGGSVTAANTPGATFTVTLPTGPSGPDAPCQG